MEPIVQQRKRKEKESKNQMLRVPIPQDKAIIPKETVHKVKVETTIVHKDKVETDQVTKGVEMQEKEEAEEVLLQCR